MLKVEDDIYKSTSRLLLTHVQEEYRELSETWRTIDSKAQGNIAISGIFVAGLSISLSAVITINSVIMNGLVALTYLFLISSALWSAKALQVSEVYSIEDSKEVLKASKSIYSKFTNRQAKSELRRYVSNRLTHWVNICETLGVENNRKAKILHEAQYILIVAILFVIASMVSISIYI